MKFSKLVEHVSRKPIPPHVKHLIVEVMVLDKDGEDVEVCHRHLDAFIQLDAHFS
jgi:ubiquitin-activating enzyme E1